MTNFKIRNKNSGSEYIVDAATAGFLTDTAQGSRVFELVGETQEPQSFNGHTGRALGARRKTVCSFCGDPAGVNQEDGSWREHNCN